MRKSVFFVLAAFLLCCENIVWGNSTDKREKKFYRVQSGNTINIICDSTGCEKDSIIAWNQDLYNKRNISVSG